MKNTHIIYQKSKKLHQIYNIISTTKWQKEKQSITESLKTHYDMNKKNSKMKIRESWGGEWVFSIVFQTFVYQNHKQFTIFQFILPIVPYNIHFSRIFTKN